MNLWLNKTEAPKLWMVNYRGNLKDDCCHTIYSPHFKESLECGSQRHDTNPSSSVAVIKPHLSVKFSIPGEYMQRDAVNTWTDYDVVLLQQIKLHLGNV